MTALLIIGIGILWAGTLLSVVALCRCAARGDAALRRMHRTRRRTRPSGAAARFSRDATIRLAPRRGVPR